MVYLIMGVAGSGKTTQGKLLSAHTQIPFLDADSFHPPKNRKKMSNGIPLTDQDRSGWLEVLNREIQKYESVILACSALKKSYRTVLLREIPEYRLIYLENSKEDILHRLSFREDHFFPTSLIDSQFDTLEPPYGESSLVVIPTGSKEKTFDKLLQEL